MAAFAASGGLPSDTFSSLEENEEETLVSSLDTTIVVSFPFLSFASKTGAFALLLHSLSFAFALSLSCICFLFPHLLFAAARRLFLTSSSIAIRFIRLSEKNFSPSSVN